MCKGKCILASLIFSVAVWPAVASGQSASRPAEPATASRPAETRNAESTSDLITRNLKILFEKHWADVLGAIFWVSVSVVLWAIGFGVAGLILGLLVYAFLHRRGLFDVAPDAPGRFRWVWGFVFALTFAVGGAYGGGWFGLERGIKHQILSKRAVDGLIVSVMQANVLHAADFELTGKETPEELQEIVAQSDAMADLVMEDFLSLIDKVLDEQTKDISPQWLVSIARDQIREKLLEKLQEELHGIDPRLLAIVIFEGNSKAYLEKYPKAKPVAALFTGFLNTIRQDACRRVAGFTRGGMWKGLIGGPLVAFIALLIFRMIVRRKSPA
jgi:hypothetical protein